MSGGTGTGKVAKATGGWEAAMCCEVRPPVKKGNGCGRTRGGSVDQPRRPVGGGTPGREAQSDPVAKTCADGSPPSTESCERGRAVAEPSKALADRLWSNSDIHGTFNMATTTNNNQ